MLHDKFLKPYNPQETESRIYKLWEESGFFNPDFLPKSPPHRRVAEEATKRFSITMPPPNVTGVLHMGHALMLTLEDIMIRFKRMQGFKTLWLPGTDHAAIATQARVEKDILKAEKKSRHDLGRDEFIKRVEAFAKASHDTITAQIRVMGASCDWSREAYTLDEKPGLAVRTMFKKMYDDGLIYRGHRIVNWDPKGQTTISDDEIVHEERKAKLYTLRYAKNFPIPIATTRPETKLGDVGVAVHPDGKWKQYIGQTFEVQDFAGVSLSIKVVADKEVDPEFGTGAIGITPPHDFTDWEIAQRHTLNKERVVINEYARMTGKAGPHADKKTTEAREDIVGWLRREGLLEKEEEITQNVSTAERTGGIVEPLPKLQWFVDVNKRFKIQDSRLKNIRSGQEVTLKELMREAVKSGDIKILPEHFEKTYFHWIENLRDWCISRQIWYGHRIPVWYRNKLKVESEKLKVEEGTGETCVGETPKGDGWIQDPDTLDTWFSSGLWTFSTLGWPEKTKDLELYHPTDVLETGYEILFFWVARMILMSGYALGEVPFKTVYLHGTVRDAKGRKMSKSLGNGIDPIDVAKKFGTDAGRMALIVGNTPGTDTNISEDKIRGYKNFANKLWNIARFIIENTDDPSSPSFLRRQESSDSILDSPAPLPEGSSRQGEGWEHRNDKQLLNELNSLLADVTSDMEAYRFYMAAEKLYHYAWHTFADNILEESKAIFEKGSEAEKKSRRQLLIHTLDTLLKALHPFIPFVTEEIWQLWKQPRAKEGMLMVQSWPMKSST